MENIRGKPGKSYRARNGACVRLPVCLFTWATQGIADSVARYCGAFRGRFGSAPRYPDHALSPAPSSTAKPESSQKFTHAAHIVEKRYISGNDISA